MNDQSLKNPQILIIVGMHRSGTSLTAALLQSIGLFIGDNLVGASESNQKGHFEDLDFVQFHEQVLRSQGISKEGWTLNEKLEVPPQYMEEAQKLIAQRVGKTIWGWKDPRTNLFLDFWLEQLPQAKFLFVYRSPWEVLDSIFRRSAEYDEAFFQNPKFALGVWQNYNQIMLNFCENYPEKCLLVSIETVIENFPLVVDLINSKLGFNFVNTQDNLSIYDEKIFIRETSNSHRPSLIKRYFPESIELYQKIIEKADVKTNNQNLTFFDDESLESQLKVWAFQDWIDNRKTHKKLKQTQVKLEETKTQLEHQLEDTRKYFEAQITQASSDIEKTYTQWQETLGKLQQTQEVLKYTQTELERTQTELERTQTELERTQTQLFTAKSMIAGMESSKFWQLRQKWINLKKTLGFSES